MKERTVDLGFPQFIWNIPHEGTMLSSDRILSRLLQTNDVLIDRVSVAVLHRIFRFLNVSNYLSHEINAVSNRKITASYVMGAFYH